MPRALIWTAAWLLLLGTVVTPIFYTMAMMDDPVVVNSLSPDADSWGIPMFSGILLAIYLSPVVLGLTWAVTRTPNRPSLFAWRRDRPIRSWVWTIVAAVFITLPVLAIVGDLSRAPPWYEYELLPLLALGIAWVLVVRAAAVAAPSRGQGAVQ